jgi:phospholipid N-methyltransferase
VAQADLIISGLPWVALPEPLRDAMLDATTTVLSPGGVFTTFTYAWVRVSTPARRFRRALGTRFEEVIAGRTILRNLPPAFVYYARRPLPG